MNVFDLVLKKITKAKHCEWYVYYSTKHSKKITRLKTMNINCSFPIRA